MIRPLTCLCLAAALGAGLYLYQEKHRAQLLDRDINRTVKQAEQARERIGLLRAEWALLNEPERLAGLAAQHLQLQPLQPTQFVRLDDLRSRLPAIAATPAPPPMDEPPVAAAAPAQPIRTLVAAAPVLPAAAPSRASASPSPAPVVAAAAPAKPASPASAAPASPVQLAAAHSAPRPTPPHLPPAAKPAEPEQVAHAPEPERRRLFAPVMPAYAPAPVAVHAPTVQTASAVSAPSPGFVGSALGMARSVLAAPVPVASAATLGATSER